MARVRHALDSDEVLIKNFIDKFWKKGHILTQSTEVFDQLYRNRFTNKIQFLLAENTDCCVVGILGFIQDRQYDNNIEINGCWLALWVTDPTVQTPVGLELLLELMKQNEVSFFACLGVNPDTLPFYERLGYTAEVIPHYYLKATDCTPEKYRKWHLKTNVSAFQKIENFNTSNLFLENKFEEELELNIYQIHTYKLFL